MLPVTPAPALLIDADNLKDATWLVAIREEVKNHTQRLPWAKAYGSLENLQACREVWQQLGVEMQPNLPLEKNTTDASLVADAMEMCCHHGVRFFAIASGDADFAPLAQRLRRWGCEVWCYSVTHNLFKDAHLYYDKVVVFEKPVTLTESTAVLVSVATPASPNRALQGLVEKTLTPKPAKNLSAPPAKMPVIAKPVAKAVSVAALPKEVQRVLKVLPALRNGSPMQLSIAIKKLTDSGVISSGKRRVRWFHDWAAYFQLCPAKQPNQLKFKVASSHQKTGESKLLQKGVVSRVAEVCAAPANKKAAAVASAGVLTQLPAPLLVRDLGSPQMRRSPNTAILEAVYPLRCVLWNCLYRKIRLVDILQAVPELLDCNQSFSWGSFAGRLRAVGLLLPSHSALKILQCMPHAFEWQTEKTPQWVRYRGSREPQLEASLASSAASSDREVKRLK